MPKTEKKFRSQEERFKDGKPFAVTLAVSPLMIGYALCGAFEGGSNYWLQTAELLFSDFPKTPGLVWYGADSMFDGEFQFAVGYDDPKLDEGNGKGRKTITRADVIKGLELMAKHSAEHFGDLISLNGNSDATTYDVFLQYVVLGEVVYG